MEKNTLTKKEVARILEEIGILLELSGENPFKSRAYYAAARTISAFEGDLADAVSDNRLSGLRGIGNALTLKITELVETGKLDYYENLKASIPAGLTDMLKIQGLGPRKIWILYNMLGIETMVELESACLANRLINLSGFGRKTQEKILSGIEKTKMYKSRRLYADVIDEAEAILAKVRNHPAAISAEIAGSLRRRMETVKDIDILISTEKAHDLAMFLKSFPGTSGIIAGGDTKISITTVSGINVDFRLVSPAEFPYALHHFTGSKEHNVAMRGRAKTMNLKMNEYGLFAGDILVACASEEEIFKKLGLSFIPPELREDRGEIAAAEKGSLPVLVELSDIKGILHVHTNASDGLDTIESIFQAVQEMNLDYVGICDHSKSAGYAGGLSEEEIERQHRCIDAINRDFGHPYIFKGIESDILPDGSLDYDDAVLERFDFIIAAVHSNFTMSEKDMTSRILKALDNPATTILAHPTGRLLLEREAYGISMEQVIARAAEQGKILELNANPHRLDLDWRWCKYAKELGVKIAINPDAHTIETLNHIRFGINIAKKGWLSPSDCINCLGVKEIKTLFGLNHN